MTTIPSVEGHVAEVIVAETGGDHMIVVGRVHGLDADGESNPLIFHKGAFG